MVKGPFFQECKDGKVLKATNQNSQKSCAVIFFCVTDNKAKLFSIGPKAEGLRP